MKLVMEFRNAHFHLHLDSDWHIRCVCHVINRAVIDCEALVKGTVSKLRDILKMVRNTALMRAAFKQVQIMLGMEHHKDVPGLDVDNRWNSMFIMIDGCFQLANVFEALANKPEFSDKLERLTSLEWRQIKSVKDFLEPAFDLTTTVSGSKYATLAMQPLIFESLESHCQDTISGRLSTGLLTPVAKQAAQAMLNKLDKYRGNLNSSLAKLAVVLDPATPNLASDVETLKSLVRDRLVVDYSYQSNGVAAEQPSRPLSLLQQARRRRVSTGVDSSNQVVASTLDEVDLFFEVTNRVDDSCSDPVDWWRGTGHKRFPFISLLARDTLMCKGSSVPSESAFSDSGGFVRPDRGRLVDENLEMMMKLRSWNRLFDEMKELK
jgi:hypothetical protein